MTSTSANTVTPAEEVRAAIAILDASLAPTTPAPWTAEHTSWAGDNAVLSTSLNGHPVAVCGKEIRDADHPASADAAWIALADPDLGRTLLDILKNAAERTSVEITAERRDCRTCGDDCGCPDIRYYHSTCNDAVDEEFQGCLCFADALAIARHFNQGGAA